MAEPFTSVPAALIAVSGFMSLVSLVALVVAWSGLRHASVSAPECPALAEQARAAIPS